MSGVAVVWLVLGLVSTAAALAVAIALVRHVLVLFRALGRFQREVAPVAQAIAAEGGRAASRSQRVAAGRPSSGPAR
jgi:hypothetical protein